MSDQPSPDIIVINQSSSTAPSQRRASSLALESIVEENHGASSTSTEGDTQSIELIDAEDEEQEEEKQQQQQQRPPRPSKRLSFAPDPVTYRSARMDHIRSSHSGSSGGSYQEEPPDEHEPTRDKLAPRRSASTTTATAPEGKMMSAVKRFTSPSPSEFTNSDRASTRRGRGRTTLFTRGSTNFSVTSSTGDADGILNENHPMREHPCIKQAHYDALRNFIRTRIQELWLPKSWDMACDVTHSTFHGGMAMKQETFCQDNNDDILGSN
eukprot:scaffold5312_cov71-Cyclotella_meneghiniana.AAC.5